MKTFNFTNILDSIDRDSNQNQSQAQTQPITPNTPGPQFSQSQKQLPPKDLVSEIQSTLDMHKKIEMQQATIADLSAKIQHLEALVPRTLPSDIADIQKNFSEVEAAITALSTKMAQLKRRK